MTEKNIINNTDVDAVVDTTGLICPEPLMLVRYKMRQLNIGEILLVIATDVSTTRDIPSYCKFTGHEITEQIENSLEYRFLIKKLK